MKIYHLSLYYFEMLEECVVIAEDKIQALELVRAKNSPFTPGKSDIEEIGIAHSDQIAGILLRYFST